MARGFSPRGLNIIRRHEGLRLDAYRDPVGVWTIGYGHTGPLAREGNSISEVAANQLLREDAAVAARAVNRLVSVGLSQNQFDALVSFVFNLGAGAFERSTLRRKINASDFTGAVREFGRWTKARDRATGELIELPGLVRRRAEEAELFARVDRPMVVEDDIPPAVGELDYAPAPVVEEHDNVGQSGSVNAARAGAAAATGGGALMTAARDAEQVMPWLGYVQTYGPWLVAAAIAGVWLYIEWRRRKQIREAKAG